MHEHEPPRAAAWQTGYVFREVVEKAAAVPPRESLGEFERSRPQPGAPIRFAVTAVVEPTTRQGKRAYVLSPGPGWSNFEVNCDEGTAIGGTDRAPSPLGYLTAAVGFCLMTHLAGYLQHVPLRIDRLRIEIRGEFWTVPPGATPSAQGAGGCERFECHVVVDSPEPPERIAQLVTECQRACMALQAITRAVPAATHVRLNGQYVAVPDAGGAGTEGRD